jgi:hypothetical protein
VKNLLSSRGTGSGELLGLLVERFSPSRVEADIALLHYPQACIRSASWLDLCDLRGTQESFLIQIPLKNGWRRGRDSVGLDLKIGRGKEKNVFFFSVFT